MKLDQLTKSAPACLAGLLVGCVLLTAAAYFFVIGPSLRTRADDQVESQRVEALHEELSGASRRLQMIRSRASVVQKELTTDVVTLRDISQLNRKIADLVATAERHKLMVVELRPQTMKRSRDYLIVPLTVTGSSDFVDLGEFLRDLRTTHTDITIGSIVSSRAPTDPHAPALQLELFWHAVPDAVSTVREP